MNNSATFKMCLKEESGGWEIVYTGFVLILLCFFIMLCTFSTMEEAKVTRFVKSFVNTLSILQDGVKIDKGKVAIPASPDMVDIQDELSQIQQNLKSYTRNLGISKSVSFAHTKNGLAMRLNDDVLFDLGKAALTEKGMVFLDKIGSLLSQSSHDIRIEGHTDNLPIQTKKFPSNWELSTTRAVNVLRYFIAKSGIPSARLSAAGFGEFQPLFPNDSPENRSKNRRVEIVLKGHLKKENSENEKIPNPI